LQRKKIDIAREYRKKYPDYPTLKLARIMYAENNLSFVSVRYRYLLGPSCGFS
jgi:hypothetical protein